MTAIYKRVADKVKELGEAEIQTLVPHFPDLTAQQIGSALINAKYFGLIRVARYKSRGRLHGRLPSVWIAAPEPKPAAPRVNSVFALGSL